jgi:hypothetical protein
MKVVGLVGKMFTQMYLHQFVALKWVVNSFHRSKIPAFKLRNMYLWNGLKLISVNFCADY